MAKIRHNDFNDTITSLLTEAKKRGVIRLTCENDIYSASNILVGEQKMINFGTCGYLGLESHPKIIEKSIEFTQRYGTQFSVSRTYLEAKNSMYLEDLLSQIFYNKNVITFSSTTLLHSAVMPVIVGTNDLIILDQQCHACIQSAAQISKAKGTEINIIRHSNLDMLEHILKQNSDKFERIWYMIDGVYSMFGDLAPMQEINYLMDKYPKLYCYIDDAHGMSWHGKNGCGRMFEQTLQNSKTMYVTTMAKGFGAMGGIAVFPTNELFEKVKIYGGALTHSHPIPPPMLGASIASAEIHLTEEIVNIQQQLKVKLIYANQLFAKTNLPVISNPETPIFFIGTGQPSVGYNFNKKILDDGFYVNIGMFPAVPIKNTGLRFTITNHNSLEEINLLINSLERNFNNTILEENISLCEIEKAFKLKTTNSISYKRIGETDFEVQLESSIINIDENTWNNLFSNDELFSHSNLLCLENSFKGNIKPEDNWDFHYILIKNKQNGIVLATFMSSGIIKDDLMSSEISSTNIETLRKENPYFLCSETLMMGSLFTEGNHLYLDSNISNWRDAFELFLKTVSQIKERKSINSLIMRDFDSVDSRFEEIFHSYGFFKSDMPNANLAEDLPSNTIAFYNQLSKRSKRHIKEDVLAHSHEFEVTFESNLNEVDLQKAYELYCNVNLKNRAINVFPYPYKLFQKLNNKNDWEFIILKNNNKIVAIGLCNAGKNSYIPLLVGIDYSINYQINSYKQMLYQVCLRAIELGCKRINFGFSADTEKKKLGAKQINKCAYLQIDDLFNHEQIETFNSKNINFKHD
ncbi:MAG: aminotransferase class I/II-fold pyridoxal phosphate-dependent enzyme [Flavobacteriia bacterium]